MSIENRNIEAFNELIINEHLDVQSATKYNNTQGKDKDGKTALHYAAELVATMQNREDPEYTIFFRGIIDYYKAKSLSFIQQDNAGNTALHTATIHARNRKTERGFITKSMSAFSMSYPIYDEALYWLVVADQRCANMTNSESKTPVQIYPPLLVIKDSATPTWQYVKAMLGW